MVKRNDLKLVSPTVVKEIPKKAGGGGRSTTTLFSIVVSMAIIASNLG